MKSIFLSLLLICFLYPAPVHARLSIPKTSSWADAMKNKEATISILWYDIEPFIYRGSENRIIGVEYELMQGFAVYLKNKYKINVHNKWIDAGSFEAIYPAIKSSGEKGLFAVSFYSITNERRKEVKFSPPYMPDLNVMVTNNNLEDYTSEKSFYRDLPKLEGFTMKATTMEEDMMAIKKNYNQLKIKNEEDDYEVLKQIAAYENAFGYVPLSIYVVALQRGIKIKRQRILATRREGFAAIFTKASDWDDPVNEYFESAECKLLVAGLIKKYLGTEVAEIILEVSASDTLRGKVSDIELLTKEREIVTHRLIDTALDGERSKAQRNLFLLLALMGVILSGFLYARFRTKIRLNKLLQEKNKVIVAQKVKMEEMNEQLNIKILQSKLNPHFLFNSLNAIQYHIAEDDRKGALNYISGFAKFLRKFIKTSDDILIPVIEDSQLVQSYLELEEKRFPGVFHFSVNIENGAGEAHTPPMLIHSILELALYDHILSVKDNPSPELNVKYELQESFLVITVTDNATVNDKENNSKRSVEALLTLENRIKSINRAASIPVMFSTRSTNELNTSILKIPNPLFKTN